MSRVRDVLDLVEQRAENPPDRAQLASLLTLGIRTLADEHPDLFAVYAAPIVRTRQDQRFYPLPENFAFNFLKIPQSSFHLCMIDDGDSEVPLKYESNRQFFSRNLAGESNSRPSVYTVVSGVSGRKELWLSPPPDAGYDINGLYVPSDMSWEDEEQMIPGETFTYLVYFILAELDPQRYLLDKRKAYATFMKQMAPDYRMSL